MLRTLLKSKIHRATVTACDLNYVGSLTVDPRLLELAEISEYEQVHVVNLNNGARFLTYVIAGEPASGQMQVNGAAARLAHYGDMIIVFSYGLYDEIEASQLQPIVVTVDEANNPVPLAIAQAASRPDHAS